MYCKTEIELYVDEEYKDYVFDDIEVDSLKKNDIQDKIKTYITNLVNDIKNNLSFSDVACILSKIAMLYSISLLCLLEYLLSNLRDKLLAYLWNLLEFIINTIMNKLMEILELILDKIFKVFELIDKILSAILGLIESILDAILTILDRFLEFISNLLSWLLDCLASLPFLPLCLMSLADDVSSDININEPLDDPNYKNISDDGYRPPQIINDIENNIEETKNNIKNLRKDIGDKDAIKDYIRNIKNELNKLLSNINSILRNNLNNFDTDLYNQLYNLTEEDYNNIANLKNYFRDVLNEVIDNNLPSILNDLDTALIKEEIC